MNKFYTFIAALVVSVTLWAQAPQKFSYQAVVRGTNNALISNKQIGMKISLLQTSETGNAVYEETHTPTSNANGLVCVAIGGGTKVSGDFATINWSNGPYFVKTETDPAGGTSYSLTTTSQLLSVPYALFAANSQQGPKGDTGAQGPIGLTGPQGAQGPQGQTGVTGATGTNGTNGANGLSAYQVWLNLGNTGTETDFITSLNGPQGLKGLKGDPGNGFQNGTAKNQISYWDGSAWVVLNPGSVGQTLTMCEDGLVWTTAGLCPGKISTLDCAGVSVNGSLYKDEANSITFNVSYEGGNGGPYLAQNINSTGVVGLTATLEDDYFSQVGGWGGNGSGSLTFEVTGTPTSVGNALFSLNIGGQTCSVSLVVQASIITVVPAENITDLENNSYKTVKIGTQQWMTENLKVSKYNDGTDITNITDKTDWSNLTTGAWAYHNNDAVNNTKYGKLYNWYAINPTSNGNKNVCPTGWHVPTDAEWTILTDYLGGESIAGGKMKEMGTINWNSPNTSATNTSMFTALAGAARYSDGEFGAIGHDGNWWSSTENNSNSNKAWLRYLVFDQNLAGRSGDQPKKFGLSVRCLKD